VTGDATGGRRVALAGLVLAGGQARRFGSDKLVVEVDGVRLVDRAVAALREVCDGPVLVASGDGLSRPGLADGQVADLVEGLGPLAAIAGGLQALADRAEAVAVLAGDHLTPSPALLRLLAERRAAAAAACAVVEADGHLQPLHAVWASAVADDVAAVVRAGQPSPVAWLRNRDDVVVLGPADLADAGITGRPFSDVDEPGDLPSASPRDVRRWLATWRSR